MVGLILLAEADSAASAAHQGAMAALGNRVHLAEDQEEALRLARSLMPDLVVIGDGFPDLCRAIKLDPTLNALAVVRLGSPGSESLEVEADAYLPTPRNRRAMMEAFAQAQASRDEARGEGATSEARWRLPSDRDELESFADEFREWLGGTGLTPFQMQQTGLAVRELASNAVEWGHGWQRGRVVSINARADEEKVSVLVRDTGPGFDPRDLPHAARRGDPITHLQVRAEKSLREGGFGILMASGLVDHLAYNDAGNEALAIKFLPVGGRAAARREALASVG